MMMPLDMRAQALACTLDAIVDELRGVALPERSRSMIGGLLDSARASAVKLRDDANSVPEQAVRPAGRQFEIVCEAGSNVIALRPR